MEWKEEDSILEDKCTKNGLQVVCGPGCKDFKWEMNND